MNSYMEDIKRTIADLARWMAVGEAEALLEACTALQAEAADEMLVATEAEDFITAIAWGAREDAIEYIADMLNRTRDEAWRSRDEAWW